ncbi:hypothetical protein D3C78_1847010 [compost metagenome]
MERINLGAFAADEGHVHTLADGCRIAQPEERLAVVAETHVVVGAGLFGTDLHHQADLQRCQRLQEEGLAARQVTAVQTDMVQHVRPP